MTGRPAAFCFGPGHVVMHGNQAFISSFGDAAVGLPAREILLDLPGAAFELMDAVLQGGQPLATWLHRPDEDWRLTVAPRGDPETGETYGVTFHLRARSDVPIVASPAPDPDSGPSHAGMAPEAEDRLTASDGSASIPL